jgi:hypothetical protein
LIAPCLVTPTPGKLSGYERRVFDQGLGRSFWFVNGGNIELIARTISDFPPDQRGERWIGVELGTRHQRLDDID